MSCLKKNVKSNRWLVGSSKQPLFTYGINYTASLKQII